MEPDSQRLERQLREKEELIYWMKRRLKNFSHLVGEVKKRKLQDFSTKELLTVIIKRILHL